jgi:nicotinate (nicotinamide) nucleotide adenylyltransferase
MDFFWRAATPPRRLAALPGTFNPPTRAHIALAHAALGSADEVLFVLPRGFPHKAYFGASFDERVRMLAAAVEDEPRFSMAASDAGLFIDIARECRLAYGPEVEVVILCGRDAAERAAGWDYGQPGAFREQLREYELLVAPRLGSYEAPAEFADCIHPLGAIEGYDEVSATEVRERVRRGQAWEHLVPEPVLEMVREIYWPRMNTHEHE